MKRAILLQIDEITAKKGKILQDLSEGYYEFNTPCKVKKLSYYKKIYKCFHIILNKVRVACLVLALVLGVALKSDHELVPVHEIMDEKEVRSLFEKMNITQNNLPKIFTSDPQAKKLNAKPGQIIKIHRTDFGNEYLYYRLVVEG